jgi:hypothetical protein
MNYLHRTQCCFISRIIIKSIVVYPSWEASQEFPRTLRKPEVHYPIQKSLTLLRIRTQTKADNILICNFLTHFSITFPSMSGSYKSSLSLKFLHENSQPNSRISYTFRTSCLFTFPHLITLIMPAAKYKSWSFALCSFLQSHSTSSLLGPNTSLGSLYFSSLIQSKE